MMRDNEWNDLADRWALYRRSDWFSAWQDLQGMRRAFGDRHAADHVIALLALLGA